MRRKLSLFLAACLSALLVSCGGGGGGTLAEGGIGGTGVSYGKAAALGSVTVNSTKYEFDNNTLILVDGQQVTPDDLKVGFVLRVEGDFDTSIASRVEYEETVRGPVENITITNPDNSAATMIILGQVIRTNSLTVFDNFVFDRYRIFKTAEGFTGTRRQPSRARSRAAEIWPSLPSRRQTQSYRRSYQERQQTNRGSCKSSS